MRSILPDVQTCRVTVEEMTKRARESRVIAIGLDALTRRVEALESQGTINDQTQTETEGAAS